MTKVRVLIVDDSPLVRSVLHQVLESTGDLEVVGEVADGAAACRMVGGLRPDVVTMDVVMPLMGGLEAIRGIMRARPTPIVVVADTRNQPTLAAEALAQGAVEVMPKPTSGFGEEWVRKLAGVLRAAARVSVRPRERRAKVASSRLVARTNVSAVGIVGSTGAPQLLAGIVAALPADFPWPIAIVQHTAPGFVDALVAWLGRCAALPVTVARHGALFERGVVVAPSGSHLVISHGGRIKLEPGEPVGGHRPSGTVLLRSMAASLGSKVAGVILTGMGSDGDEGIAAIEAAGGLAIVEDPDGAAVGSMPMSAIARLRRPVIEPGETIGPLLAGMAQGCRC